MKTLIITLILDASGSMMGKNIAILNATIVELFPSIKKFLNIKLRAIKFADSAEWHIGPIGLPINDFIWKNLNAVDCGETCTCLLYTSPSPRDRQKSRMPSSA